jgi:3-oxoacyl-[acyl-carrier protein] reductase
VDHKTGGPGQQPGPGLDVLVNNAGVGIFAKVSRIKLEEWDKMIHTNLTGAFYCSREALSIFERRGAGYIVNVDSLAGKNAFAGGAACNPSKFGLNGFSEALLLDTRYDNGHVSAILPGSVATEFGKSEGGGESGENRTVYPDDLTQVVRMSLQMPQRTMVSQSRSVRPSRNVTKNRARIVSR